MPLLCAIACAHLLAAECVGAQSPWDVTITAATNPLPIGNCSRVYVDLKDTIARGNARNTRGSLITIADFDMTASAPDPTAVVGSWNNPNMWEVCACQVAAVGMPVTLTATYPGKMLAANKQVPGVAFQATTTMTVRKGYGTSDPPNASSIDDGAEGGGPVSPRPPRRWA